MGHRECYDNMKVLSPVICDNNDVIFSIVFLIVLLQTYDLFSEEIYYYTVHYYERMSRSKL